MVRASGKIPFARFFYYDLHNLRRVLGNSNNVS